MLWKELKELGGVLLWSPSGILSLQLQVFGTAANPVLSSILILTHVPQQSMEELEIS